MSDNLTERDLQSGRMHGSRSWPECPKRSKTPRVPIQVLFEREAMKGLLAEQENRPVSEQEIRHEIDVKGGVADSIQVLITKRLSASDVSRNQNRLNIGWHPTVPEFLSEEEKSSLIGDQDNNLPPQEISARLIEPFGQQSRITLKMWQTGGGGNLYYVLTKQWWKSVVEKHKIKAGDTLRVLSFRVGDGQLGIALVKNPLGGN